MATDPTLATSASVSDVAATDSPSCPWPWCCSEIATSAGAARVVAHVGPGVTVQVPPDELIVYPVAVDDGLPSVVVEPTSYDWTALVLDLDQAARLAAVLHTVVDTAAR